MRSRARTRPFRVWAVIPAALASLTLACTAAPPDPSMPTVDLSRIPPGVAGEATVRIQATDEAPARSGDGTGAFRSVCGYSHMNTDDPLVAPGRPGVSHLHSYFGNTLASASTTSPATLRVPNARSTCRGGTANLSAYWVPSLIDTRSGTPLRVSMTWTSTTSPVTAAWPPARCAPCPRACTSSAATPRPPPTRGG